MRFGRSLRLMLGNTKEKYDELCLARMKSGETLTLMEVRSGSDVQIDHRSWV